MHWRTIWILFALVALLAGVAWWRGRASGAGTHGETLSANERQPFDALDPARVVGVRLDHVERAYQARFERQADGAWRIVDPIEAPADGAWVAKAIETARSARGTVLVDADLERLALDPPRAVLEFTEEHGADTRTWRLELGARDVDVALVHVRALAPSHADAAGAEAVIVRVPRTLETTLDRNLDDLRSRRILAFAPERAQSLERRGDLAPLDAPGTEPGSKSSLAGDLALGAERTVSGWLAGVPRRAALDSTGMFLLCARLANLDAADFRDDAAPIEPLAAANPELLARHGLDQPLLTLRVQGAEGDVSEVHLGVVPLKSELLIGPAPPELVQPVPPEKRTFTCRVLGRPIVYEVDWDDFAGLTIPFEALLEYRLASVRREDVRGLELVGAGRETVLELDERTAGWAVGSKGGGALRAADQGAVEQLLGKLERAEILVFMEGATFHAGIAPETIAVMTKGGERLGGELGMPTEYKGLKGRMFRRFGEQAVGLVAEEVGEWPRMDASAFESLVAVDEDELELARIEVRRGAQRVVWVLQRNGDAEGQWWLEGARAEDREFALLVDGLLNVKVKDWVEAGRVEAGNGELAEALADAIEVRLARRIEGQLAYVLEKPGEDGLGLCRVGGRVGVVKGGMWEALGRLLDLR